MPEGIDFKKPFNYSASQIKRIMESADEISFILHDPDDELQAVETAPMTTALVNDEQCEEVKKTSGQDCWCGICNQGIRKCEREDFGGRRGSGGLASY